MVTISSGRDNSESYWIFHLSKCRRLSRDRARIEANWSPYTYAIADVFFDSFGCDEYLIYRLRANRKYSFHPKRTCTTIQRFHSNLSRFRLTYFDHFRSFDVYSVYNGTLPRTHQQPHKFIHRKWKTEMNETLSLCNQFSLFVRTL